MIVIVSNILLLGGLIWYGRQTIAKGPLVSYYYPAVALKLLAGMAVGLVYLFHYSGGDTWNHFQNARFLAETSSGGYQNFIDVYVFSDYSHVEHFFYANQPRSALFCKIIALFNYLTGENYWLTGMYFSLFSFAGLWYLAGKLFHLSDSKVWVAISILFFPSLVFWSSGIMKETIAIGAMSYVFAIVVAQINSKTIKWKQLVVVVLLIYLTYLLKYYYAALLAAVLLALLFATLLKSVSKNRITDVIMWFLLLVASLSIFTWAHPNLSLSTVLQVIVGNHDAFVRLSSEQNLVHYANLEPTWQSIAINTPKAWFSGLFAPLIPEAGNVLKKLVVLENWVVFLLTITSLFVFRLPESRSHRMLLFAAVSFISLMAIFLALSTPNLGTLARYKMGFMPILLYLVTVYQYKVITKIRHRF